MDNPIDNNFSTRSGIFTAASQKISMRLNAFGEYDYFVNGTLTPDEQSIIARLDGLRNADEDEIALSLYGHVPQVKHDSVVGYYTGLYCGFSSEGTFREDGSSGGIASWILVELLKKGMIDGVVAAAQSSGGPAQFEYRVLRTVTEVQKSAKSRYYPMELSSVLATVREVPGRYAVVGIPSFVSDLRRLQRIDPIVAERIVFTVSLLCGHQKTTKYGEAIAFDAGFMPGSVENLDFRYKSREGVASGYVTEIVGRKGDRQVRELRNENNTYVTDWSAGMFKSNFSDFVDDCFGETSDISLGDAWVPPYISDPRGTNVVIVRNPMLQQLLDTAASEGRLSLDSVSLDTVKSSQSGLIRHYRHELPYRLSIYADIGLKKRVHPSSRLPLLRRRVQDLRLKIARRSKEFYLEAESRGDWSYFEKRMDPLIRQYRMIYRLIRVRNLGVSGSLRRIAERNAIRKIRNNEESKRG